MLFILIGCVAENPAADDTDPIVGEVTYYQDVRPILQESCVGCHNRDGIGTFPLMFLIPARCAGRELLWGWRCGGRGDAVG